MRATPAARRDSILIVDGVLKISVTAAPEDGKANKAIIGLLAQAIGCAPSRIGLLRGETARNKLFRLAVD